MKRKNICILALCLMLLLSAGCSAKASSSTAHYVSAPAAAAGESYYAEEADSYVGMDYESAKEPNSMPVPDPSDQKSAAQNGSKIIYNSDVSIRCDDPAQALNRAIELCASYGGYLANSYMNAGDDNFPSYANATLRVPADRLDALISGVKGLGKVEYSNINSDDISQAYYDISARLEATKAEEASLLKLLNECTNVEEVLMVRQELLDVRQQIESYQTKINRWDNQVSYATLTLNIQETVKPAVEKEKEPIELWKSSDVWKKIKLGFSNSWRFAVNAIYAIGIAIAYALIPIILIGAIVFGIVKLIVFLARKSKAKRAARQTVRKEKQEKRKQEKLLKKGKKEQSEENGSSADPGPSQEPVSEAAPDQVKV